jgi:hypothetical protein
MPSALAVLRLDQLKLRRLAVSAHLADYGLCKPYRGGAKSVSGEAASIGSLDHFYHFIR